MKDKKDKANAGDHLAMNLYHFYLIIQVNSIKFNNKKHL